MTDIRLLPMTRALLDAEDSGLGTFSAAFGREIPHDWPPEFHDARTRGHLRGLLDPTPANAVFTAYYILADDRPVGTCGFKGPPDSDGRVDVGYSVVASEQRRGHAAAALRALLALAFADGRVFRVVAETIPSLIASQRTAESCGFTLTDRRPDPQLGEILTYNCPRPH